VGKKAEADQESRRMRVLRAEMDRIRKIITREMDERPHDPDLHFQVGMTMLRVGAVQDAMRWFQSALRENPRHRPTHAVLADYYLRTGNGSRSVRHREMAQGTVVNLAGGPAAAHKERPRRN